MSTQGQMGAENFNFVSQNFKNFEKKFFFIFPLKSKVYGSFLLKNQLISVNFFQNF